MTVVYYIRSSDTLLTGSRKYHAGDEENLKLFAAYLTGQTTDQLLESIKAGVPVKWHETYDVINPFRNGDIRSAGLESVWLFDLENNSLFIRKKDQFSSAGLELARQRELTLADFTPLASPPAGPTDRIEQLVLDKPWEPDFECISKTKSVPGRILKDFVYIWRHLLRRRQNDVTFAKLAHAVVNIAILNFSVSDRTGFDHSQGGPYVWIDDLPQWDTPNNNCIRARASWFVLTQDITHGVDLIQQHIDNRNKNGDIPTSDSGTYAILTLQHIVICRVHGKDLEWTRPEVFFNNEETISDRAIDMILWAVHSPSEPTLLHKLPMEIQDLILRFSRTSSVGAATLGCQLGLGSPFTWGNKEIIIEREDCKRKRNEFSEPESQIFLEKGFTGVSYKPRRRSPRFLGGLIPKPKVAADKITQMPGMQ
ncbi:hypothetical protein FSARC_12723 [Fusarium sarcochroum]|uniref:Uncharacterized protein n=1 Tax=Fusarium sarcochroum TaxID=1208366 RepID=A0A8H4T686_9HYPO|nr:hypothetical protein FSARC_12723 [Fusarium sarcochroum]